MTRTKPSTSWNRNRFTFGIVDIHGAILTDKNGAVILFITDTNPIITSWQ